MTIATFTLLGVGTSSGVPRIGCNCFVCAGVQQQTRNRRQRVSGLLEVDGKKLLIDAGPDIRNQLLEHEIGKIDGLFITHNHFDHIAGIDDVKWAGDFGKESILVYVNRPTHSSLKKSIRYLLEQVSTVFLPPFNLKQVKKWERIDFHGWKVQTLSYSQQNEGHSSPTEVMGFRVGDFAFLTDIKQYDSRLIRELKGIKTMVLGAVRDGQSVAHFTFEEAFQFSKLVGNPRTIFIHLDHTVDYETASKRLPPNVELGYDGCKIMIQLASKN